MIFDFNKAPYWDDYTDDKGYYKILFRPGYAVQTRELNQLQTMLQKQIERFGNHIFREGSVVLDGQFDSERKMARVEIAGIDPTEATLQDFVGKEIVGADSELRAYVVTVDYDETADANLLFVRYLTSNDSDEIVFRNNEALSVVGTGITATTAETNATGEGSIFRIQEGVLFAQGYFIRFPQRVIVTSRYTTDPTISVGFRIQEPVIATSETDSTLLDNAQGTFNFAAPGADRLILSLDLDTIAFGEADSDDNFLLLADIKDGQIYESSERTQYARIYDEIAKRTSDESGDYYVNGMTVRTREHLDTGLNEGLDPNGDENSLSIDIEPGLAYVKGYEINKKQTHHEIIDKGIDFKYINNAVVSARTGGFIVVNEIVGAFDIDEGTLIDLYDTAEQRVTNSTNASASPSGTQIGTARVKTVAYDSGTLGAADGSLQLYLFDINMTGGSVISEVNAVAGTLFFADIETGLSENIDNTLIYRLGTSDTRKLRSESQLENSTDTSFTFYTTQTSTIAQNTKEINVSSPETLAYTVGILSAIEKRDIFVSLNTALGAPNNLTDGHHFDLTDPSVTVEVTSSTSLKITLGDQFETITSNASVTVSYKVRRSEIFESAKELVPDVYVKIGFSESGAPSTDGPIPLGLADVYRIKEIRRKNGADFTDENDGTDVTSQFIFDNGQRDNYYDHATIRPSGITLASDDYLLIRLDYFSSDTHSYFSVDSYPIDDTQETNTSIFTYQIPSYTTSFGGVYQLRDCLDYRPVKTKTAAEALTAAAATMNPGTSNDFITNETTNKLLIPLPSSRIELDYSYYLARRDVLTLDRDGNFSAVRGAPSINPVTPSVSENVMAIANIFIPPYPSISQTFARILGLNDNFCTHERIAQKRFTMRDIGVLKDRIENLEYYNALNLIEKETSDLQILDENGLDRFKNGFFAEGFLDHSLGDTTNPDYNIAVDKIEQTIRPVFDMDSFDYEYDESQSSLGRVGNLLHLPIESEEILVEQNNVTTTRNVEQSVYRFLGNIELDPDNDTWVDETTVDKNVEFGNDLPTDKLMFTEWGSWETNIVGYDVSRQAGGWTGLKFRSGSKNSTAQHLNTYTSYGAAVAAARAQASYSYFRGGRRNGVLETISQDERSGIQTTVNFEKETQQLGNFVTDVSLIPYIRPQAINIYASGIKPRTRHFVFFDGEDVTEYVRQYTTIDNPTTFTAEGSDLRTNEFGEIRAVLYLPAEGKRFRTGTKEVVITDNLTDSLEDVTSRAETTFIASGLNVQRQNTTLSTKIPTSAGSEEIFETRNRRVVDTKVVGPSCIAYTFRVDVPADEEGAFITSIDLFFQQFHPELGFRVQIRELNSAGNITQNVLPYSEVWVDRKIRDSVGNRIDNPDLKTSTDGSVATNVEFKAPVFLYNETSYAVVISAENINPDTYLWISRLGETDLLTGEAVTSRRLTGAVYTTNNSVNWDIVPQADLKLKLYRAKFAVGTNYTGLIKNKPYEYFNLTNVSSNFNNFGEVIRGSDRPTITITSGLVNVGNEIVGQTSNASGNVVFPIDGDIYPTTAFGLQEGEAVEFFDGTTLVAEGVVGPVEHGTGILKKYVPSTEKMQVSNSNGKFFEGGAVRGELSERTAEIESYDTFRYSVSTLKPDFINFNDTSCLFEKRGRFSDTRLFDSYVEGNPDATTAFDVEYSLLSRSQEVELFGESNYSTDAKITMQSDSEYVSPILDLSRAHSIYVQNTINADATGEEESSGGNLLNTYISKTITLDDGQDAEDLIVFLSAYRPPSNSAIENDIKVWMRVKNAEDPTPFDQRPWMEMIGDNTAFSSLDNDADFIGIQFDVDPSNLNVDDVVSYTTEIDETPVTLSTFKQYQIKIGLVGNNSAIVPRVGDLRAIALQK